LTGLGYSGRNISISENKSTNPNNKSHTRLRFDLFSFSAMKINCSPDNKSTNENNESIPNASDIKANILLVGIFSFIT